MRLVYIDDAKDRGRAYFSGLMIDSARWVECKQQWSALLDSLRHGYGFRSTRELHATKLLSAHGHYFERRPDLATCISVHREVLRCIAGFPSIKLFLSCGPERLQSRAFERLITRVNRTSRELGDHAMLICDEGKTYDNLLNALRESNPIIYQNFIANHPLTHIVEDIVYRDSAKSFMIQAADACVYTFFRREDPLPRLSAAGFDDTFDLILPVVAREASRSDPYGIIRC